MGSFPFWGAIRTGGAVLKFESVNEGWAIACDDSGLVAMLIANASPPWQLHVGRLRKRRLLPVLQEVEVSAKTYPFSGRELIVFQGLHDYRDAFRRNAPVGGDLGCGG